MTEEAYVSFETAKLLKEKGFDVNVINSWHIVPSETCNFEDLEKVVCGDINEPEYSEDYYPLITLQMAMKWLREVHNIFICIFPSEVGAVVMDYTYALYKIDAKNFYFEDLGIQGRAKNISEISYEKTVEAGIKYCLENLI